MGILDNLELTYKINITELDANDTVNCKINTLQKDHQLEWKAIDRMKEIIGSDAENNGNTNEVTQAFNEIMFTGKEPGYRCEITIPQLTASTIINGKKLDVNSVCRAIKGNNHIIAKICNLIIKGCFNIDSFETVRSDLNVADTDAELDNIMSTAEFKSNNKQIGLLWSANRIDENGYTMVFEAVIE